MQSPDREASIVRDQEASKEHLELLPAYTSTAEHRKRAVASEAEGSVQSAGNVEIKPPGGAEPERDGAAGRELELDHGVATKAEEERRPREGGRRRLEAVC